MCISLSLYIYIFPKQLLAVGVLTVLVKGLESSARMASLAGSIFPSFLHIKIDVTIKNT